MLTRSEAYNELTKFKLIRMGTWKVNGKYGILTKLT